MLINKIFTYFKFISKCPQTLYCEKNTLVESEISYSDERGFNKIPMYEFRFISKN